MKTLDSNTKEDHHKELLSVERNVNLKVLLVEDNRLIQYVMNTHLKELGCQVDVAKDGLEAVNMYQNDSYHIIFLDIGLPKIGGVEVTQIIRAYEKKHENNPAVIIATTVLDDLVVKECKEAGMDDFYNKPLLYQDLVEILKKWSSSSLRAAINQI